MSPRRPGFLLLQWMDIRHPGCCVVEKCGIVTFSVEGHAAQDVTRRLSGEGLNTSVSAPSSTLLDVEDRNLDTLVRASVHYYNTEEEVARFCEALEKVSSRV
jgi:cysteine desulfurase/selenocysteine lyase